VVLGGAWWCRVLVLAARCCLALPDGAWWCMAEQCVWFVLFGARFLVVLGGASWCSVVLRVNLCCLTLLGGNGWCLGGLDGAVCWSLLLGAAWRCLALLGGAWWCLVLLGAA
jgi:hypothetical protein